MDIVWRQVQRIALISIGALFYAVTAVLIAMVALPLEALRGLVRNADRNRKTRPTLAMLRRINANR